MKRKFNPLPEYQEVIIVPMTGTVPVTWRNRHGFEVTERCYSGTSQRWTIEHRENAKPFQVPSRFNSASDA